jgi:glucosamine--fructose-6-phosphate aminotransferase (isomerizing)
MTVPILAGPELSVAATKTFVTSLVAGLWVIAEIKGDTDLLSAISSLPDDLEAATQCDWSPAAEAIDGRSLFTLGRGPSWAISNEAALKFKETCLIHAESYSSAEVLHGPVSIVGEAFPVIAFASADKAEDSVAETADALAAKGARVFALTDRVRRASPLPFVRTGHWLTDPIAAIVSFYGMVESVAVRRGINPDTPRHLNKVTETV